MDVDGDGQTPAAAPAPPVAASAAVASGSSSGMAAAAVPTKSSQLAAVAQQQPSGESRNVIAGNAVPSVACSLHPLVIMNVSDHWTRIRAQKGFKSQVFGALIGKQKGRNIEVMNSFELKFDMVDDEVHILMDYYNVKEQQCEGFFGGGDLIGL